MMLNQEGAIFCCEKETERKRKRGPLVITTRILCRDFLNRVLCEL
jgi:hypothetical protein